MDSRSNTYGLLDPILLVHLRSGAGETAAPHLFLPHQFLPTLPLAVSAFLVIRLAGTKRTRKDVVNYLRTPNGKLFEGVYIYSERKTTVCEKYQI